MNTFARLRDLPVGSIVWDADEDTFVKIGHNCWALSTDLGPGADTFRSRHVYTDAEVMGDQTTFTLISRGGGL